VTVAESLRDAGFEATVVEESWGRQLELADPDGQHVTVRHR
jgi:hypothetical protein